MSFAYFKLITWRLISSSSIYKSTVLWKSIIAMEHINRFFKFLKGNLNTDLVPDSCCRYCTDESPLMNITGTHKAVRRSFKQKSENNCQSSSQFLSNATSSLNEWCVAPKSGHPTCMAVGSRLLDGTSVSRSFLHVRSREGTCWMGRAGPHLFVQWISLR